MNSLLSAPGFLLIVMAFLTLAPLFLMMVTSFVKTSIVFSILRNAMGAQQVPPNIVLMGLSLILTIYIMHPVIDRITISYKEGMGQIKLNRVDTWTLVSKGIDLGLPVLKDFLKKNSDPRTKAMFKELSTEMRRSTKAEPPDDDSIVILVPSFVTTELKESFEIGIMIYLPFLVIDMLVSSILVSMGMHMLSPVTVSLPFKLLLFVLADGWSMIAKGLVLGYNY